MHGLETLQAAGIPCYFASFSALDKYFGTEQTPHLYTYVVTGLVELVKTLHPLEFPGLDGWDAVQRNNGSTAFFRCVDGIPADGTKPFSIQGLLYDPAEDRFLDPVTAYPDLRRPDLPQPEYGAEPTDVVLDAAVLCSRYGYDLPELDPVEGWPEIPSYRQQILLTDILTGQAPWKGLEVLLRTGFIEEVWPLLHRMSRTDHTKDYHPEGNVWRHSLETLRYRKTRDLLASVALLLHDCGKPLAERTRQRAFDGHAELGAAAARTFLRSLGFPDGFVEDVYFLVRNHMYPAAIHKMPIHRTRGIMSSGLFPLLLEVYRCDLLSSFQSPDGYYRACRVYREFMKHDRNPYRGPDGKKLLRLYVESV
jgi:poly(A) polymerase